MRKLLTAAILGAVLAGCTSTEVLTIRDAPINPSVQASNTMGAVIEQALAVRGWQVADRRPGAIDAYILVRQHRADITVSYDADSYSIEYRDSQGLDYLNGHIHRNYNRWVANLNQDIQAAMAQAH